MDHHLGDGQAGNSRKTVITDGGKIDIDVPRDRQSSFDPQLIAKYQRRFPGFDDKIISMYARGVSTREIVGHLHDLYGIDVSPDLTSTVTDAVLDEVATWQQRPLDAIYPLVFFDAIRVNIRDEGMVRNKAIHIALGVRADGAKEVLGLRVEQTKAPSARTRRRSNAPVAKFGSNCVSRGVERGGLFEHGVEGDEEFASGCDDGELGGFSVFFEPFAEVGER
jgi:transposase-like protein